MDRREFFLKTAKASGLVLPWWGMTPLANAQAATGKFLVVIHADGGIDSSSWIDPREQDPAINNYAAAGTPAIRAGQLKMAPMGNHAAYLPANFQDLLFVSCNTETNSHGDGDQASATGRLEAGFPTINELFAATYGSGKPMNWLNSGGSFSMSAGLVTPTPLPDSNALRATVTPLAQSATNDFVKQSDFDKTLAARAARIQALEAAGASLPREKKITAQFLAASEGRAKLAQVAALIPAVFDAGFQDAHVLLIAAQAGIASTGSITRGGFDGHGQLANSYNGANGSLTRLTNTMQYITDKAATLGLSDRIVILVRSEFGRTPLNGGNGKDHWNPGGTMVFRLPPGTGLGNRMVGATNAVHQSLAINPKTGALDPAGVVLKPRHILDAAQKYLGIQVTNPMFSLGVPASEALDLFNPNVRTGYPFN
jgi:hypothetical protein